MPEAYHPDDQLLADFIEGRLADSDQTRVESHIRDCSECCKRLGKLTLLNLRAETLDRGFVRQDAQAFASLSLTAQLKQLELGASELSKLQREVVERYYLRQESLPFISAALGISTTDAARELRSGIQCWRQHLNERDGEQQ